MERILVADQVADVFDDRLQGRDAGQRGEHEAGSRAPQRMHRAEAKRRGEQGAGRREGDRQDDAQRVFVVLTDPHARHRPVEAKADVMGRHPQDQFVPSRPPQAPRQLQAGLVAPRSLRRRCGTGLAVGPDAHAVEPHLGRHRPGEMQHRRRVAQGTELAPEPEFPTLRVGVALGRTTSPRRRARLAHVPAFSRDLGRGRDGDEASREGQKQGAPHGGDCKAPLAETGARSPIAESISPRGGSGGGQLRLCWPA